MLEEIRELKLCARIRTVTGIIKILYNTVQRIRKKIPCGKKIDWNKLVLLRKAEKARKNRNRSTKMNFVASVRKKRVLGWEKD